MRRQVERGLELVRTTFPSGTQLSPPLGGFLAWLRLPPDAVDALTLQRRALAQHINVAPGPLFTTGPSFDRSLRLSFGHPWTRQREARLAALGNLAR